MTQDVSSISMVRPTSRTPDPEVPGKASRRRYPAKYKLKILREADACTKAGEVGALLRREGLYSSLLSQWRRQRDQGALSGLKAKKRGRKTKARNPLAARVGKLEKEDRNSTAGRSDAGPPRNTP